MDGDPFSFETLSKQEALERKQPRLTKLDPEFWDQLQKYLRTLEANLRAEQQRNPTSRKIALVQDELRNASRKSESLWEAREKKITLHALKGARGETSAPPENSLKPEQVLYEELLQSFRRHVPDVVRMLEKPTEAKPAMLPPMPTAAHAPTAPPAPVVPNAPSPAPSAPATAKPADESVTVRVLVDMPPFVGLDGKTHRLKKGDVLTLPRRMVEMLAKRGQVAVMG